MLLGGALLLGIGAGLIAAHVTVFALDESVLQQSAVHYSSGLPGSLIHDVFARATDRLYSLALSIAYRFTGGPRAIRIDHVLSVAMFISAAFPIYLVAGRFLRSRWSACWVALLSIAAPWLALTSALFTENLSYPLFWWAALAMLAALESPSLRRDLLVLAATALLIGTRVQFVALFAGYLVCLVVLSVLRTPARGGWPARARGACRAAARGYPLTVAITVLALVVIVVAHSSGGWTDHVNHLLGSYTNVVIRSALPPNMAEGVLVEAIAISLGVGLVPALVAVPWYLRRLSRPGPERAALACLGCLMAVFLVLTVYSQGGYLGNITEERYFFYVAPVLWIGTFAALADPRLRRSELMAFAVLLAVLFGSIPFLSPLTEETAFLAPVESVVGHVEPEVVGNIGLTGLGEQDALMIATLVLGGATALLWKRDARIRVRWALGVSVLLQLAITSYAFATLDGAIGGIQGRTSGSSVPYGWVDYHAHGELVTWLEDLAGTPPPALVLPAAGLAADQVHMTLFWNSQLRSWASVPSADDQPVEFPISGLPEAGSFKVGADGLLTPAARARRLQDVVEQSGSPLLQLAGTTLARSPDGYLSLTHVVQPARVSWLAQGLEPDGSVTAGKPVRLTAGAPVVSSGPSEITATLLFEPVSEAPVGTSSAVSVSLGADTRTLTLPAATAARSLALSACAPAGSSVLQGQVTALVPLDVAGRVTAGRLVGVTVSSRPLPPGGSCSR